MKLLYEWRNIYRMLQSNDFEGNGKATKVEFEAAVTCSGTYLTKEELSKLYS